MMRTAFVVNRREALGAEQTTTLLIGAALRRGHDVLVLGVGDLSLGNDGKVLASGCEAREPKREALVRELAASSSTMHSLDDYDLCVVRTNPGRDGARMSQHVAALRLLERLVDRGGRVVNHPRGLSRAQTKLSLLEVPSDLRPRTLVTRDPGAIERFIADEGGRAVIKPLEGSRGRDVFVLDAGGGQSNTKQIIDVVLRQGYAVVQELVPGAEAGDVRVTVVDGEILEVDGRPAVVARVPPTGDFRSNLHVGGTPARASATPELRAAVAEVRPVLLREGLRHVGIDFVGRCILELNVFSPGGLFPSETLYERDFSTAVIEAFERPS